MATVLAGDQGGRADARAEHTWAALDAAYEVGTITFKPCLGRQEISTLGQRR